MRLKKVKVLLTAAALSVFTATSSLAAGWMQTGSDWKYITDKGTYQTGWFLDSTGLWYYLKPDGLMLTGWFQDADMRWYFLKPGHGSMQTGIIKVNQQIYLMDGASGALQTGRHTINGITVEFGLYGIIGVVDAYGNLIPVSQLDYQMLQKTLGVVQEKTWDNSTVPVNSSSYIQILDDYQKANENDDEEDDLEDIRYSISKKIENMQYLHGVDHLQIARVSISGNTITCTGIVSEKCGEHFDIAFSELLGAFNDSRISGIRIGNTDSIASEDFDNNSLVKLRLAAATGVKAADIINQLETGTIKVTVETIYGSLDYNMRLTH